MKLQRYVKNSDDLEISEDGTEVRLDVRRFKEDENCATKIVEELDRSPRRQGIPLLLDFEDQFSTSQAKFLDQFWAILETEVQTGLFKRSRLDLNGVAYEYHFSFAVGMGSLQFQNKYRKYFRENFGHDIPDWVDHLHPRHIRLICEMALENLMPLPESHRFDGAC